MFTQYRRAALAGLVLSLCVSGAALAQSGGTKPSTAPGSDPAAVGVEALALFERVCIAALVRNEAPVAIAAASLTGAQPVPAAQLRTRGRVRETAGWRVRGRHGRHTVMMLDPGAQCAIYTGGVDPEAFLAEAQALMLRTDLLPGRRRQGDPARTTSSRPYGTLTLVRTRFDGIDAVPGKQPLPGVTIAASAADRTDGRADTAVITTDSLTTTR